MNSNRKIICQNAGSGSGYSGGGSASGSGSGYSGGGSGSGYYKFSNPIFEKEFLQ